MEINRTDYTFNSPSTIDYKAAKQYIDSLSLKDKNKKIPSFLQYLEKYFLFHPAGFGGKYQELREVANEGGLLHFHNSSSSFSLDNTWRDKIQEAWGTEDLDGKLRELAKADLDRLKRWLDKPQDFPNVEWEKFGFGAEIKEIGGGILILIEDEDTWAWVPDGSPQNPMKYGYEIHKGAYQTLERLHTLGVLDLVADKVS